MINIQHIEKIEPIIKEVADLIIHAVKERDIILMRHHADCDGYAGALAIEEVILPIIQSQNIKAWQKYRRLPMKAPFYTYSDAVKDIDLCRNALAAGKKPLLVMIDNGSGEEDLLALKRLKQYDIKVIIIDHHIYSEKIIETVDKFLNSRTVYGTGDLTAGMLCFEVASKIGHPRAIFPALSGVADKSTDELIDHYKLLAGKSKEFLQDLARCVDFEAHNIGYMESDSLYDFFNEKQEKMIKLLLPLIDVWVEESSAVVKKFMEKKVFSNFDFYSLDLEKTTSYGDYMSAGKMVGIMHRLNTGSHISMGFANDFVTVRSEHPTFSVVELMGKLKEKIPYGKITGGGHEYAGTIKFILGVKEELVQEIKVYLKSL